MTRETDATGAVRRHSEALLENNLLVVTICILACFLLVVGRTLLGVDSWLTLVAGREIVENGLPHHDTLTVLARGRVWTDQQWLAQLMFYGLVRAGGLGLAVLAHALLVTAALCTAVIASRVRGASARMTLLGAFVCLVVAPWSWQLRAQSLALPLFALVLGLVATDERLQRPRTLFVFPALLLWANVHGSVVLGALLVSVAGLLVLGRRLFQPPADEIGPWRATVYLLLPGLCVFASPYGFGLWSYYKLLFVDSDVSHYITEWQAPKPHGFFLVFFAVAALTVVVVIWQRRRLSLFDIFVLAVTLAGAVRSVRAVVWFSLALAILLPVALDGIAPPRRDVAFHRRLAVALIGLCATLFLLLAVFTVSRSNAWFERGWPGDGARTAARLAAVRSGDVYAADTFADWLLWKEPTLRGHVAWDARFELLTRKELRDVVRFKSGKDDWRAPLAGWPILVLDPKETPRQVRVLARPPATVVLRTPSAVVIEPG